MDKQEVNDVEDVPEVNTDDLKNINADLKELIQFLKDEKLKEQEIAEAEKQLQIEAENQQNILDEEERLEIQEQEKIDLETEQALIDSENEYRKTLLDSVNAQNQKMDTYIQNTDGLLKSFELMNANTELLIENTAVEDNAEQDDMSFYADSTLVMIVWVFLPLYISYRLFKPFFNKIL